MHLRVEPIIMLPERTLMSSIKWRGVGKKPTTWQHTDCFVYYCIFWGKKIYNWLCFITFFGLFKPIHQWLSYDLEISTNFRWPIFVIFLWILWCRNYKTVLTYYVLHIQWLFKICSQFYANYFLLWSKRSAVVYAPVSFSILGVGWDFNILVGIHTVLDWI